MQPVSSMFQMSCVSYPEIIDPRGSFQEYTVASGTSADSPQSLHCERLWRSLNLVNQPLDALNSGVAKFLWWIIGPSTGMRCSVFFLNHSHTASFMSEYCEVQLCFFALENPLSYSSLTRVFCFRMLLTCVFPQPNFSASLPTPVNPLLFSYSSTIWKCFSKGNSFLAFYFVLSFGVIQWWQSPIEHSMVNTRLLQKTTCKLDMYWMYQLQLHKRFYVKVKWSLCLRARRPIRPALTSGFISMKRLGVFLLPPGWDATSISPVPIYTPEWREALWE